MIRIGISSNTAIPCFQVIKSKGYSISSKIYFIEDIIEDATYEFIAEKDGNEFVGDNLEEVLGLITMWEHRGNNYNNIGWRASHDEHLEYRKVLDNSKIFDKDGNEVDEDEL